MPAHSLYTEETTLPGETPGATYRLVQFAGEPALEVDRGDGLMAYTRQSLVRCAADPDWWTHRDWFRAALAMLDQMRGDAPEATRIWTDGVD